VIRKKAAMARNPSSTNPLGVHSQLRVGDVCRFISPSYSILSFARLSNADQHHLSQPSSGGLMDLLVCQ
jgi:hypothetical protein